MSNEEKIFMEIKSLVIKWYENNQIYFKDNYVDTNVLCNEIDRFIASFENDLVMAELIVERANCMPYRFISFEIAGIENNQAKILYSWYDKYSDSEIEITKQLTNGINYIVNISGIIPS
ncbi:hypothetical protein J8385_18670 [Acinetobacter baumannii]|nr:hypothetical protein [Acinetobacter baumannii]